MSSNPWSSVMPGGVVFSRPVVDEDEWESAPVEGTDDIPVEAGLDNVGEGVVEDGVSTSVDTAESGVPVNVPVVAIPDVIPQVAVEVDPDDEPDDGEPVAESRSVPVSGLPVRPVVLPTAPVPVAPAVGATESGDPQTAVSEAAEPEESAAVGWSVDDEDDEPPVATRLPFIPGSPLAPLPIPDPVPDPVPSLVDPVPVPDQVWEAPVVSAEDLVEHPAVAPGEVGVSVDTTTVPDTTPGVTPDATPVVDSVVATEEGLVDTTTGEVLDQPEPITPDPINHEPTPASEPPVVEPVVDVVTDPVGEPVVDPVVPEVALLPSTPQRPAVTDVGEDWSAEDLLNDDSDDAATDKKAARAERRRAKAAKGKSGAIALTDRDTVMFTFLARYRFATYPQLARYFNTTPVALRQRMPRLAKEGFLVRKPIGKSQHGVWLPTDTAMKVAGMDLPTPTLSWATAAHTLGLVDIGIMYELEGEQVVTEREIRAADQRDRPSVRMRAAMLNAGIDPDEPVEEGSPRLYVVPLGSGESHYGHIPDMVLARPNNPDGSPAAVAVELELNHKPATQWRKILRAYLNAPNIGQVIYYTPQRKIAAGIAKAAQEVGAEHMVQVRRFHPSESSAIAQNSVA